MEYYNYLKSLHLIFVITWFAGFILYASLFANQMTDKPSWKRNFTKQYKIMTTTIGISLPIQRF
jgi:putative membrane protein